MTDAQIKTAELKLKIPFCDIKFGDWVILEDVSNKKRLSAYCKHHFCGGFVYAPLEDDTPQHTEAYKKQLELSMQLHEDECVERYKQFKIILNNNP